MSNHTNAARNRAMGFLAIALFTGFFSTGTIFYLISSLSPGIESCKKKCAPKAPAVVMGECYCNEELTLPRE